MNDEGEVAYNLHNIVNGAVPGGPFSVERRLYSGARLAGHGGNLLTDSLGSTSPVMIGDAKRTVYRTGVAPGQGIFYNDPARGGTQAVATIEPWEILSPVPGISDDGKAIEKTDLAGEGRDTDGDPNHNERSTLLDYATGWVELPLDDAQVHVVSEQFEAVLVLVRIRDGVVPPRQFFRLRVTSAAP